MQVLRILNNNYPIWQYIIYPSKYLLSIFYDEKVHDIYQLITHNELTYNLLIVGPKQTVQASIGLAEISWFGQATIKDRNALFSVLRNKMGINQCPCKC